MAGGRLVIAVLTEIEIRVQVFPTALQALPGVSSPICSPLAEDAAALLAETLAEDEFDNVIQVLALLHRRGGRHEVHHPQAVPEPQAHRVGRAGNRVVRTRVEDEWRSIMHNLFPRSQRRLRQRDPAERGHQEAEQAVPERHPRQESLQRIQTDEASEPQKREYTSCQY